MDDKELLALYIQRLQVLAEARLQEQKVSVIEALKLSINQLEGEMRGY